MTLCVLCGTPYLPSDPDQDISGTVIMTEEGRRQAHRACLLRNVLGGIGHLTDHATWCIDNQDPDAGLSYRESALKVDDWVAQHGVTPLGEEHT